VQLRGIQRAVLGVARLEVRRLREVREFALGWRAAVPLLESRRAGAQVGGDRFASGGEQAHRLAADALDFEPVPVVASGPFQAEPSGEGFLQVLGGDRGDSGDVLVVAQRVRGPPFPVGAGLCGVGDLGVDVQLHVTIPGGVLQPVGHGQAGLVPLARFAAVDAGAVGSGAGVAGLALEVAEASVDGLPDHVVDLGDQAGPVRVALLVAGLAGQAGVLAQRGVEERDRLGQRDRQVEEEGALPRLPDGLSAEFALAFGGGVRLGGQQRGVQVGGFPAVAWRAAELSAVGRFTFAEKQIVRLALDGLPGLEAERSGAGAPPAAGWLSPGLAGLDVIAGRVLGGTAIDLLPDVVKVIALAQGCDNRQGLIHRQRARRDCPCSSHGAWVWRFD
jgi:hypothetical protein